MMLAQQFFNALVLGSVYAVFALGFTLIFGVVRVINLLYGFYFTVGAFVALMLTQAMALPLWAAAVLGALAAGMVAMVLDGLLLTPLRKAKAPELASLTVTLGGVLLFTSILTAVYGTEMRRFPAELLVQSPINWGSVTAAPLQLLIIVLAILLVGGLFLFIEKSRMGAAIR
ncbi:MAG TPA: branched-chain amino acid ABC transporter permease, partial [Rhodospirillaceae bacterium]|nr:branched-chain amino acid ABC transporter permease [Rhodospirillaceae bacterium]